MVEYIIVGLASCLVASMFILLLYIIWKLRYGEVASGSVSPTIEMLAVEDQEGKSSAEEEGKNKADEVELLTANIMDLSRPLIAALKSYKEPPDTVFKIMVAVYMILGEPKKRLKKWDDILVLMLRTNEDSLVNRIGRCNPPNEQVLEEVRGLLAGLKQANVANVDRSILNLFLWAQKVCEET